MSRTGKSTSLGDHVFEQMLDLIHRCELRPGTVLNESELAIRFGVSRGPIREAIRRLQGIQLVSREPFLKARVIMLSREALADLFGMREVLEGYACGLAAQRMTDAAVVALAADLEAARRSYSSGEEQNTFDFHERIVRGCGNERVIATLCGELYHLFRIYRRMSGAVSERKDAAYAEHWQIVRAIRARDADLAESLMRSHIRRAADHILIQITDDAPTNVDGSIAVG